MKIIIGFFFVSIVFVAFVFGTENERLRVLVIGAHPDDCEIGAGGLAALYLKNGHAVKFVSMTNGEKGHHLLSKAELAKVRKKETESVNRLMGIEYEVFDNADGELEASMANRLKLIKVIREWDADIVITHRPNTYHPDHRYTSILVSDASFLIRVPHIVPEIPPMLKTPVFLYMSDAFKKPNEFVPDVAIDITEVLYEKVEMLHQHYSQFYQWLPWLNGKLEEIPKSEPDKKKWLQKWRVPPFNSTNPIIEAAISNVYGDYKKADQIQYIELYELCEYGRRIEKDEMGRLFPFN